MHGFLAIDKPLGWTSHDVVARVRRLAEERRIGHAGTLDPLATGVLILCLGQATRLSALLMDGDKWYMARVALGAVTTTDDAEGEIIAAREPRFEHDTLLDVLSSFTGEIEQAPPQFAAVKVGGAPAYKRARAGATVTLVPRRVHVHGVALIAAGEPGASPGHPPTVSVDLLVHCSKGTYIRSLARDLGERLGCGGYLAGLRRLASGGITVEHCHTLPNLEAIVQGAGSAGLEALLEPLDLAVRHLPALAVGAALERRLRNGGEIAIAQSWPATTHVDQAKARAYGPDGRLIALVTVAAERSGTTWWRPSLVFEA
jgi:tRNA pseudouridine55 synthase